MGLTKQYLRYVPGQVFNVIASAQSNVTFVQLRSQAARYVATGGCENVLIWDSRTGEKVLTLVGEKHEAKVIQPSPTHKHVAVGYGDGVIRLFDLTSGECVVAFSGHQSAVTCLDFDSQGMRLASGSNDTNVPVWDVVAEAGLFKLSGHKGPVTKCCFLEKHNMLISSSRDMLVKFWDFDTQHCFKTLVGHRSEIWDMALLQNDQYLVTGCSDNELKVWKIEFTDQLAEDCPAEAKRLKEDPENDSKSADGVVQCTNFGTILRQGKRRLVSFSVDSTRSILACHGIDSLVELFRFRDEEEIKQRFSKRQRKAKKKALEEVTLSLQDVVSRLNSVRASSKVKSVDIQLCNKGEIKLAVLIDKNSFEIHQANIAEAKTENVSLLTKLSVPGHRTDVRALCFSSDNIVLASASDESLKIWNRSSQNCIRTMECDKAVAALFAPGDRHMIIATKTGKIQIFDVAASRLSEEMEHQQVRSICLSPDLKGLASGGADVKFWQFQLIAEDDSTCSSRRLSLVHTKTLQLEDLVLCVRFSPDHRLIAVSQLDATVKIFFVDTLKFFLSLYGHSLPVKCMDISYDSKLIITGGDDRLIKIWGLDFGNCHRSISAHENSITAVQFVSTTHLFFSCAEDGLLKQWDADNFESIVTLRGHHGDIWTLAVSKDGKFVGTAGRDRSIRFWEKTREPLVLEDERETEREVEADQALATSKERVIAGQKAHGEASLPGRKTAETERAAERIMQAVQVHQEVAEKMEEYQSKLKAHRAAGGRDKGAPAPPQRHPLMEVHNTDDADRYLLCVLRQVKSSELEEALLVLPFDYVARLLKLLDRLLELQWETELLTRIVVFLVRLHHGPLSSAGTLLPVINRLKDRTRLNVDKVRDRVGFNLAALQLLQRELEERQSVQLFSDASSRVRNKRKQRQDKDKAVRRAILSL